MHKFNYPAKFRRDTKEGGFIISFRDIPEAITETITEAKTLDDCFIEDADCLEEAIAGRIDDGLNIPKPSKPGRSEYLITVPVTLPSKYHD